MAHDATPDKAATPAPAGWLERLARTSAVGGATVPPDAALRPRLPYPFEAMKFGADDAEMALPRHGADRWPAASSPPARQDDAQPGGAHHAPPATAQGRPAAHGTAHEAAHEAIHAAPHDAAPAVMPSGARPALRPVDAPAPAGPHHAASPAAAPSPGTARGVPSPVDERDDGPAPAGPAYPAPAAPLAAAGTRPPADARREIVAPGAVTAAPRPVPADAGQDQARRAIAPQATADAPTASLRSAAVLQAPLPAKPAREAAPDITIDIQIGRIEVRAPSGPAPAAPAPAAASTPRAGDALQAYLLRRGRGARS